jgi:uncharacterized membrane protein
VKKALLILLVLVVVVTGIPLMAGMSGAADCPDCGPAVAPLCGAAVLVAGVALALGLLGLRLRRRPRMARLLLHSFVLERPPRLA